MQRIDLSSGNWDMCFELHEGKPMAGAVRNISLKSQSTPFGDKSVVILNTNYETRNSHITGAIVADAREALGVERVVVGSYHDLVEVCSTLDSPILLCIDGQRLNNLIVEKAIRYCAASVLWTFEDPYNLNKNKKNEHIFDLVCTNDAESAGSYDTGALFLPLAAQSSLLELPEFEDKPYDVFFCGTAWPNRVVLLNKLLANLGDLKCKFVLNYNRSTPKIPLDMPASSYVHTLAFKDYIEFARRSKITLGLHRNFAGSDDNAISSSPGPRIFEVGAVGAYQISERMGSDVDGVPSSEELDVYRGWEDLEGLIRRNVNNEDYRLKRASALREDIAKHHTYVQRIETILVELGKRHREKPVSLPQVTVRAARPKLLYVVHNTLGSGKIGGLEVHQDVLAQNISTEYEVYFLATRGAKAGKRRGVLLDSNYKEIASTGGNFSLTHNHLESKELEDFFGRCVENLSIDLVHFFHFMHQAPSLGHIAKALNVPYVVSFHDFFAGCQRFNLLDWKGDYCQNDRSKIVDCDVCLSRTQGAPAGSQLYRRDYIQEVIEGAESLIFMSAHTKRQFEGIYPELRSSNRTRIHGAPIPSSASLLRRNLSKGREKSAGRQRVAFVLLGNFGAHKGSDYLLDALRARPDVDAEFHFHGSVSPETARLYGELIGDRAVFHGPYSPGEIDVASYDFSLHLSVWPETYCQTLSEAWAARITPIVTDIGALGERVSEGVNGYKVDPTRPGSLTDLLRQVVDDPKRHARVQDSFSEDLYITQPRHASMYREVYERVVAESENRLASSTAGLADAREGDGVTLRVLERQRRSPLWGASKTKTGDAPSEPLQPDESMRDLFGKLVAYRGKFVSENGDLNWIKVGQATHRSGETVELKNAQAGLVAGWVRRPLEVEVAPMAFLRSGDNVFTYPLSGSNRRDVAEHYSKPEAAEWGVSGEVRLLVPDEMLLGEVVLSVGWVALDRTCAWVGKKSIKLIGRSRG